jgi:hypothetical protein
LAVIAVVIGGSILAVGALLLPGSTLSALWDEAALEAQTNILALPFIVAIQLFVMRHFQTVISREMATRLLKARIECLRDSVLIPLQELKARTAITVETFEKEFVKIRTTFFAQAIYHVLNVDIFGRSPVYLVGVRLRYISDHRVLDHFAA